MKIERRIVKEAGKPEYTQFVSALNGEEYVDCLIFRDALSITSETGNGILEDSGEIRINIGYDNRIFVWKNSLRKLQGKDLQTEIQARYDEVKRWADTLNYSQLEIITISL